MARLLLRDLTPGTNYKLQLRAVEGDSVSEWSRLFDLPTSSDVVAPETPEWATQGFVDNGDTFIATWVAVNPETERNRDLSHYEIEFSDGISSTVLRTNNTSYTLTFDHNRSMFGTPRSVVSARVRAVDGVGNNSPWNTQKTATNPAPAAPASLTTTPLYDSVKVSFAPVADLDVTKYIVQVSTTSASTGFNTVYNGMDTEYVHNTTMFGSDHWYRAYAQDKFNTLSSATTSGAVRPKSSFQVDTVPPAVPTGLSAAIANNSNGIGSRATLAWTQAIPSTNDLAGFRVRWRKVGDTAYSQTDFSHEDRDGIVELQVAFQNYEFQIRSYDWMGNNSAWSNTVVATAPANVVPGKTVGVSSVSGRDSIRYSWTASTSADLKEYEVTTSTSSAFTTDVFTFKTGRANYLTASGLNPATTYYMRVRALNASNNAGAFSDTHAKATLSQLTAGDVGAPTTDQFGNLVGKVNESIKTYNTQYAVHSSETTAPTTGWASTTPTRTPGTFVWSRAVITYTDGTSTTTNPVILTGNTGSTGPQGSPGIPGTPGADGSSLYTWLKYADSPTSGMDDSPAGKTYMGIAVNKTSPTESTTYSDYSWTLIKGEKGVAGQPGADGVTTYTWIKYADSATPTSAQMSDQPAGKTYIGLAFNKTTDVESTTPSDYQWALIQGPKGDKGDTGSQGIQGPKGNDGTERFTWLKYADSPTAGMNDSPVGKTYMGVAYNKTTATESSNYADYEWSLIKGADGSDGKGVSTTTVNYQTGTSGTVAPTGTWSTTPTATTTGQFLWTRTVTKYTDNSESTAYSVSAHGAPGAQGSTGSTGAAGRGITGTVVDYAKSTNGTTAPTTGWTTTIPATVAGEYLWTRTVTSYSAAPLSVTAYSIARHGVTGSQGIQGPPGADGLPTYTWIKYSANADGTGMVDDPTAATKYIGVAYNKQTQTESTVKTDYDWSLIQGPVGPQGDQGPQGPAGIPAALVDVVATSQVLASPPAGGATNPATVSITGTAVNTTISGWHFSVNGAAYSATVPAGVAVSGNTVTITGATMTARTIGVKANSPAGVSDTTTVAKISDGAQGPQGNQGPQGLDAYTVLLTNEAMVFAGSTTAALAGSETATVVAYKGAAQQTATIGTITGQVTGLTTAITANGTSAPVVTVNVTTALVAQTGVLTIPVTVDGKVFNKVVSWSVSRQGTQGPQGNTGGQGNPGTNGSDGVSVTAVIPYYFKTTAAATAPAKPTTATPVAGWTTTEPAWTDNSALWRTEKISFSNGTFIYTDVSRDSSYTAAVQAMDAANGKNKIMFSDGDATGTNYSAGDVWYKRDATNSIIGTWEFTTTWQPRTYSDSVLKSLSVGKLVSGAITSTNITLGAGGVLESLNYASAPSGFRLTSTGLAVKGAPLTISNVDGLQTEINNKTASALNDAQGYVRGKGVDLIVNGFGTMGNNTNFSQFAYRADDAPTGAAGSFYSPHTGTFVTDEFLPVDPNRKLKYAFALRETGTSTNGRFYGLLIPYDAYKKQIEPRHYMRIPNTTTTLAQELKPGDTTVVLTSSANWYGSSTKAAGASTHLRSILWWDFVDDGGKLWPENTYSRNHSGGNYWADGAVVGNTITLNAPYSGPVRPAGTKLSNGSSGGTYMYSHNNLVGSPTWADYSSTIGGLVDGAGASVGAAASFAGGWPPGVGYAKAGWLLNRTSAGGVDPDSKMAVAAISLSDATAAQEDAAKAFTRWAPTGQTTIDGGKITADSVTAMQIQAYTIDATKLVLKGENLIADPQFTVGVPNWAVSPGGRFPNTGRMSGSPAWAITNNATQQAVYNQPYDVVPSYEGAYYNLGAVIKNDGANIPINGFRLGVRFRHADGSFSYGSVFNEEVIPMNAWKKISGLTTAAPANTVSVSFFFSSETPLTTGTLRVDFVSAIRAASGELIVDGSITGTKVDADVFTGKEFNVKTNGAIKSSDYDASTGKGWRLNSSGLDIQNGTINASTIRSGNLGGPAGTNSVINLTQGTSLVVNGGYIKSNTNTGTTLPTAETSGAGFFINADGLYIGGSSRIRANALISDVLEGTIITLGAGAEIKSGGFTLNDSGLSIPEGSISASKLEMITSNNVMPVRQATWEGNPNAYSNGNGFFIENGGAFAGVNSAGGIFGVNRLAALWGAQDSIVRIVLANSATDYNIPVYSNTPYIFSLYTYSNVAINSTLKVKWNNGSETTLDSKTLAGDNNPKTATRLSGMATAPVGATGAQMVWETSTKNLGGLIAMDGAQAEIQTSPTQTGPTPWTPWGLTTIDGSTIKTGAITSNGKARYTIVSPLYDEEGTQIGFGNAKEVEDTTGRPAFSINPEGSAEFSNMLVRGDIVVGTPAGDADGNTTEFVPITISRTSGSAVVTAEPDTFYQADVGLPINSLGFASGSKIVSVSNDGASATLSVNATSTAALYTASVTRPARYVSNMRSYNYVEGATGWILRSDGTAELKNLVYQSLDGGAIKANTLSADTISSGSVDANLILAGSFETKIDEYTAPVSVVSGSSIVTKTGANVWTTDDIGASIVGSGLPEGTTLTGYSETTPAIGYMSSPSSITNSSVTLNIRQGRKVIVSKDGVMLKDAADNVIVDLPTKSADPAAFSGRIKTDSLEISGEFYMYGADNNLAQGSELRLNAGTFTSPPPNVTFSYDGKQMTYGPNQAEYSPSADNYVSDATGWCYDPVDKRYYFAYAFFGTQVNVASGPGDLSPDGHFMATYSPAKAMVAGDKDYAYGGMKVIGNTFYFLTKNISTNVWRLQSFPRAAMKKAGGPTASDRTAHGIWYGGSNMNGHPAFDIYNGNLYIAKLDNSNRIIVQRFNGTNVEAGSVYTNTTENISAGRIASLNVGKFDYGSTTVYSVVTTQNGTASTRQNYVYHAEYTTATTPRFHFPLPNNAHSYGLAWIGSSNDDSTGHFRSLSAGGYIYQYGQFAHNSTATRIYSAAKWRYTNGSVNQFGPMSRVETTNIQRRAKLVVSAGNKIPNVGIENGISPNAVSFYMHSSSTGLRRLELAPVGVTSQKVDNLPLTATPAESVLPDGVPSKIVSGELLEISGNGFIRTNRLILQSAHDASTAAGNTPPLMVGNPVSAHLRIDANEIIAMSGDTGQGALILNPGNSTTITNLNVTGNLLGTTNADGSLYVRNTIRANANGADGGGLFDYFYNGGGTTGATIGASGRVVRTGSSQRFKNSIEPLQMDTARKVLDLESVTFKWNEDMDLGARRQPGFIAEQAHSVGLGLWVTYDGDDPTNNPSGIRYPELTAAHNMLIKELYAEIESLKVQINNLAG